ncbi:MAG TPA: hypothetical protein VM187_01080, partial [Niastella sp.]|nr:hypothetical protein [Niastella sp.]
KVGQAVIAAIAIATKDAKVEAAKPSPSLITYIGSFAANMNGVVRTWLNTGDRPYTTDSNSTFITLPPTFYGAEWIQMPEVNSNNKVNDLNWASFNVTSDADVFFAVDSSQQLPQWLSEYEDSKMTLQILKRGKVGTFKLYRKRFTANSKIKLSQEGGNGMMYFVIVTPVTTLQPPFDQKSTTSIKMDQATNTKEGSERQTINKRESVVFTKPAGGQVDFTITPGVADVYAITFRYSYSGTETRKGKWQLIQADGTVMKTEAIEFTNTREGKWNYFTTTTGSMINAGKYTVRITAVDAEGVAIGGLDVQ